MRIIKCIRIGLQRSTWWTLTFLFRSFCDRDRSYSLRSRVRHGSTRSSPSGSPCLPVPLGRSKRAPLPTYGKWASGSPTTSTCWPNLGPIQRAVVRSQGLGTSAHQPVGASGQPGKEKALPCAENLFSLCRVRLGEYDGTLHGRVPSEAGMWYHRNGFRGSWGIWHP